MSLQCVCSVSMKSFDNVRPIRDTTNSTTDVDNVKYARQRLQTSSIVKVASLPDAADVLNVSAQQKRKDV